MKRIRTYLAVGGPEDGPDSLRLEQTGQVSVGHLGLGEVPACLGGGGLPPGAVQGVWGIGGQYWRSLLEIYRSSTS